MATLRTTSARVKTLTDNHVIALSYCTAQFLLDDSQRFAYTAGIYGHNSDVYVIDRGNKRLALSIGYRPFGKRDKKFSDLARRYEKLMDFARNDNRYRTDYRWGEKIKSYLCERWFNEMFRLEFGK